MAEIAVDRDQLQEKWQTARSELLVLRGRFSVLSDEHDKLKEEHDSRVPAAVHTAAVNEVKRYSFIFHCRIFSFIFAFRPKDAKIKKTI